MKTGSERASLPSQAAIQDSYPPFPHPFRDSWISQLLADVQVRGISARWHHCQPTWNMRTRRIPDDMLFYITDGGCNVTVESRASHLRPGTCAHFRSGVWHSGITVAGNPFSVIAIHYRATVFESLSVSELLGFPDVFELGQDKAFAQMAEEACRVDCERPAGHARALDGIASWLLLHLIWQHGDTLKTDVQEARLADLLRLRPAIEAMREHLHEPPSIATLAQRVGLSEVQFRRVFQRTLGSSPVTYVRRVRMEQACRLLRHTDQTVEAIAQEVGYVEPSFFARTFKQLIGTPPGEYRKRREL